MTTRLFLISLTVAGTAVLAACGSTASTHSMSGEHSASAMPSMPGMHSNGSSSTHGGSMSSGTGLDPTVHGYTLAVRSTPMSETPLPVTFVVTKNNAPVTRFDPEQTNLMHFYLIRSDLSGFQHLHPTMGGDGTWTVTPSALTAGSYRIYVQFLPHALAGKAALVLSRPVTVRGGPHPARYRVRRAPRRSTATQ